MNNKNTRYKTGGIGIKSVLFINAPSSSPERASHHIKNGLLLLLLSVCIFSCSCSGSGFIEAGAFGDDFRNRHAEYFLYGDCKHYIKYINPDGKNGYDPVIYHYVCCAYDNCGFEPYYEVHPSDKLNVGNIMTPQVKPNGLLYHIVYLNCGECRGGNIIRFCLCGTQNNNCDGSCLPFSKGEVYPCDTQ